MDGTQPAGEPRWDRELLALWKQELALFVSTAAGFARHPQRFGAEWAAGRSRAMNPLGYLAASWSILLPIDYGLQAVGRGGSSDVPLLIELARAVRPYLFVIPMAVLLHLAFRWTSARRRLSTTLGILLYWTTLSIVGWIVGVAANLALHAGSWLPHVTGYATMLWGGLALAGAHRVPWGVGLAASEGGETPTRLPAPPPPSTVSQNLCARSTTASTTTSPPG